MQLLKKFQDDAIESVDDDDANEVIMMDSEELLHGLSSKNECLSPFVHRFSHDD